MRPRSSATIVGVLVACAALGAVRPLDVQTAPTRPRLTGINHVAFRVRDEAAARRFYGDVLGLSHHPSAGTGRIVYDVGDRQRVVLEPGLAGNEDERLSHLAFDTPDVTALSAYLASRGITAQPAGQCQEGAVRVTDPDGHTIEFVAAKWPPDRPGPRGDRALSARLLHAGLIVRDEEAAHRFYRDALGFSEIWRGGRKEGVTQWVNMRVPDGTDYLEYMLVTAPPDRRQRGVLHHQALLVPDIQPAWEEVVRRTPEVDRSTLSRPQIGVNNRWQLNLLDPDGTRTELMEPFTVR
jgi:catechol 2,3-dioxygenase-like lactoylglutathione lyase family enzyme